MRAFFGVILFIIGGLVALGSVVSLLNTLSKLAMAKSDFEYNSAYLFGSLIGFAFTGLIAYLIIYAGAKLYKKKKEL